MSKTCLFCGTEVNSIKKKYCNNTCKNALWYKNNSEKNKNDSKKWREANKDYKRQKISEYKKTANFKQLKSIKDKQKRANNPEWRIRVNLRSRLSKSIRRVNKSGSAVKDLGCSITELKLYLESKFQQGMTWDNYGEWHIDHIIPLSSFNLSNRKELLKACHYTNLQPLWAKENRLKSNKEIHYG